MLMFADVAMVAYFKSLFPENSGDRPEVTVAWGAPESQKRALVYNSGQAKSGLPGIVVFRTNTARGESFNVPRGHRGIEHGANDDGVTFNMRHVVDVMCDYTIHVWATSQSDLAAIERELWFTEIYNYITLTIQENEFRFPVLPKEQSYSQVLNEETGKVIWYELTKRFQVPTQVIHSAEQRIIQEILVNLYERITSGEVVTEVLLSQISILPEESEEDP